MAISRDVLELVLRQAVMEATHSQDSNSSLDKIPELAMQKAQNLLGLVTQSEQNNQLANISGLIKVGVASLSIAYHLFSSTKQKAEQERAQLDIHMRQSLGMMFIPENKERKTLSNEQLAFNLFLTNIERQTTLKHFFHIDKKQNHENGKLQGPLYLVSPFYKLSESLPEPTNIESPSDNARKDIRLFLQNGLPEYFENIEASFQHANFSTLKKFWHKENYLNQYRLPYFILVALANLVWQLQYPVSEQGFCLSLDEKISVCSKAESFLNRLASHLSHNFEKIAKNNHLLKYIDAIEGLVKKLKFTFEEERHRALCLDGSIAKTQESSRILNHTIFKLVYGQSQNCGKLALLISELNNLLQRDQDILKVIAKELPISPPIQSYANAKPQTVIDVFIYFAFALKTDQCALIDKLEEKNQSRHANRFAEKLRRIRESFIIPIKQRIRKEIHDSWRHRKRELTAEEIGRCFIPIVALCANDYQLDFDFKFAESEAPPLHNDKTQIKKIIEALDKQEDGFAISENEFYYCNLSVFQKRMSKAVEQDINKLPTIQYQITKVRDLLIALKDILDHYRSFLQSQSFQELFLDCLEQSTAKLKRLEAFVNKFDQDVDSDAYLSRDLLHTFTLLTEGLTKDMGQFAKDIAHIKSYVSTKEFCEEERAIMDTKIHKLQAQYEAIFHQTPSSIALPQFEERNIRNQDTQRSSSPFNTFVASAATNDNFSNLADRQQLALSQLINRCLAHMSKASREGFKGQRLYHLKSQLMREEYNEALGKSISLELARIVCAYRRNNLFFCTHANYANTRSAKCLIEAISEPSKGFTCLPLSKWLFNKESIPCLREIDAKKIWVKRQLLALKAQNHWQSEDLQCQVNLSA
jgi:hypothetical protein